MKRRLLKILLVTCAVVAFTGYFAFSTFFFSPLEKDYGADVATLIPRNVDFYVAKANLAADFAPFPVPAFADELATTTGGRTFFVSPEWQAWRSELGLAQVSAEIERAKASLPLAIDLLDVLGGREAAVAGYFRGGALDQTDWALYARGNWMAKLALSLLSRPGLFDLASQGVDVVAGDETVSLSGASLPRALHVARVRDVFIVTTDPALLKEASELAAVKGADSFGGSARYFDHIQQRAKGGNEAELFLDYRSLSEALKFTGRWPDQASQDFLPAFAGRLFQSGALKELAGVARFETGATFELHGELSSEVVSPFQKQLYRQRSFDRDRLFQVSRFAPADAALCAYAHVPIGPLVEQVLQSLEPAARDNLDDLVREVWGHPDYGPLVAELDGAFHDRALFIVRNDDYVVDEDGPPHDGSTVFAWSLVLWIDDAAKIEELRKKVVDNQVYFAIHGASPGEGGVYTNKVSGGQLIYEYWSPLLPGTGHLASMTDTGQGIFVLSNHHRMIGQVLKTWFEGAPEYPRLAEVPRYEALVTSGATHANAVVYVNPQGAASTLRELADRAARDRVVIPWDVKRDEIDRAVLEEHFPDRVYEQLTEAEREELEIYARPARDRFEREFRDERVPEFRAEFERQILYAEQCPGALIEFGLDAKEITVFARWLLDLER